MGFVKVPNLPEKPVKSLVLGQKYFDPIGRQLALRHAVPILLQDNPCVDPRMAGHADLSVLHLGGNRLLIAKYLDNSRFLDDLRAAKAEVTISHQTQGAKYPKDANLNVCVIGKQLIYNSQTADCELDNLFTNLGLEKLLCRQGYSRCAVCVVNEKSIITADNGISEVALKAGLNVLHVKPDLVSLDGFEYGFIGGASFKLSSNEIAFTGHIADQNEKNRIENFLSERNVKPIYLTDRNAFDVGGAIPLTE